MKKSRPNPRHISQLQPLNAQYFTSRKSTEPPNNLPSKKVALSLELIEIVSFYLYKFEEFSSIASIASKAFYIYLINKYKDTLTLPNDIGILPLEARFLSETQKEGQIVAKLGFNALPRGLQPTFLVVSGAEMNITNIQCFLNTFFHRYKSIACSARSIEIRNIKISNISHSSPRLVQSQVESISLLHISTDEESLMAFLSLFPKLKGISLTNSQISKGTSILVSNSNFKLSTIRLVQNIFYHDRLDQTTFFLWIIKHTDFFHKPSVLELKGVSISLDNLLRFFDIKRSTTGLNKLNEVRIDNMTIHCSNTEEFSQLRRALSFLPQLEKFSFRTAPITFPYSTFPFFNLVELDLSYNPSITSSVLMELVSLSKSTLAILTLEALQAVSIESIIYCVKNTRLEKLNISYILPPLSPIIENTPSQFFFSLREFTARGCLGLQPHSFHKIIRSVAHHTHLLMIDLSEGCCSSIRIETIIEAKIYLSRFSCKLIV